jgi:hypothetical protein
MEEKIVQPDVSNLWTPYCVKEKGVLQVFH